MAYTVSQNFKAAVKDETARKSCLILFGDLFFTTEDFTDQGVVFNQFFNTSDDLTFGDCPSDTLSFSVVANGALAGYSFGKCRAFLGVQTDSQPYAFGSINAHIEVGAYTWTASDSGLYCDGSLIDSDEYVSLVSDGTYVYAVGLSSSYRANIDGSDGATWTPHRFIAQKLRGGLSAVFDDLTAYVWDGESVLTYEYVPMGVYNVTKPRSTVGDVVTVQDAYDNMSLFDRDATEFLDSLSYPITLSGIYTALCDFIGVSYASSTFTYSTTSYASSPFSDTSCTLRDILWWIAERARAVAHFNRVGELALMVIGTTEETLTASDIGQDGYSIAEYRTPVVTGVLLRSNNGATLSFGSMDVPYVISANPFVSTITNTDLQAYWNIPTYVPIELNVLEADPSIDIGDMVNIKPMVDEIVLLTNVYNEIYVNEDLEAYALKAPTYEIPLMNREITFMGAIRAKYAATGNEVREADISDTEYNANVAPVTQMDVFNRLTNGGEEQGIYIEDGKIYINADYIKSGTIDANLVLAGAVTASNITATGGVIGGFTLDSTSLSANSTQTGNGFVKLSSVDFTDYIDSVYNASFRLRIGGGFGVDRNGNVYASQVYCPSYSRNWIHMTTSSNGGRFYLYTGNPLTDVAYLAIELGSASVTVYDSEGAKAVLSNDGLRLYAAGSSTPYRSYT